MKKPKKFDTFLYRHFKNNGHSPSKIIIQTVENIIYDQNSSSRFINIKRHEVLDCIDSWSLQPYLLWNWTKTD